MKHTYKKTLFALFVGASLFSCDLDRYNPNNIGDEDLKGFANLSKLVVDCYYPLNGALFNKSDYIVTTEMGTDLWATGNQRTYAGAYSYYDNMNTSVNQVNKVWEAAYSRINTCNAVIAESRSVTDATPDQINAKIAEAYCLRAYYYSILVEQYGNVTLSLLPADKPEYKPQRSTVEKIYAQMVSDLRFAEQYLPVTTSHGWVSKKTAKGLLARVYLQGSAYGFNDEESGKSYVLCAKEVAEELIDNMSLYNAAIYSNFADVFSDANNRTNTEALFIAPGAEYGTTAANFSSTNNVWRLFLPRVGYYTDLGKNLIEKGMVYGRANDWAYQPTKYLMDVFSEKDNRFYESFITTYSSYSSEEWGLAANKYGAVLNAKLCEKYGIDKSFVGDTIWPAYDYNNARQVKLLNAKHQPVVVNDPLVMERSGLLSENANNVAIYISKKPLSAAEKAKRPYFCINIDEMYDADGQVTSSVNINTQIAPMLRKYLWSDPKLTQDYQNKRGDVFIMRMAEVYLIAAEANTLLGGANLSKAAEQVNVLRERACDPSDFVVGNMKVTASDMNIDFILDERARELCGEYSRWYDLKRTKTFETRLAKYNHRAAANFDARKHYLRPVSQNFLNNIENPDEYGRNPGY